MKRFKEANFDQYQIEVPERDLTKVINLLDTNKIDFKLFDPYEGSVMIDFKQKRDYNDACKLLKKSNIKYR